MSGLSAAITAASADEHASKPAKIVLVEAQPTIGGRVSSDFQDGFTFDRGFAVFIDQYPQSKRIFDYEALQLKPFEPGALIRRNNGIARVADPLRQPRKLIAAVTSPVGSFLDKLKLAPLLLHVRRNTVEELFVEEEMDTLTCLKDKYKFSDKMIREFFEPFLTGIYFCQLEEQSSRMFHFVFKMFSEGAATLPTGGMQAASNQLMEKASNLGVNIHLSNPVTDIKSIENENGSSSFKVSTNGGEIICKSLICATEGVLAAELLADIEGLESLRDAKQQQQQRSVGSMYYTFQGESPVNESILVLNGAEGNDGTRPGPVNSIVFPHVCNESYAPENHGLCSVSLLGSVMDKYARDGKEDQLDHDVRAQLSEWFPEFKTSIEEDWSLEKTYIIRNAQPSQLQGPFPANVHGGRDCSRIGGLHLKPGLFVCGDYMVSQMSITIA